MSLAFSVLKRDAALRSVFLMFAVVTLVGSIVVLFPSQYATNIWANTTYYYPPVRNWGFDTTFLKGQNYQPPMSPQAKKIIRSVYSAW